MKAGFVFMAFLPRMVCHACSGDTSSRLTMCVLNLSRLKARRPPSNFIIT